MINNGDPLLQTKQFISTYVHSRTDKTDTWVIEDCFVTLLGTLKLSQTSPDVPNTEVGAHPHKDLPNAHSQQQVTSRSVCDCTRHVCGFKRAHAFCAVSFEWRSCSEMQRWIKTGVNPLEIIKDIIRNISALKCMTWPLLYILSSCVVTMFKSCRIKPSTTTSSESHPSMVSVYQWINNNSHDPALSLLFSWFWLSDP